MNDSKLLILGANGQLGKALKKKYPNARAVDSNELDISSREAAGSFDWSGIEVIINAAAYTDVDGAETTDGRRRAWAVNAAGVADLAHIATKHDLTFVHISSDYVFDGTNGTHTELEGFSPLNAYGASKAGGDIVAASIPKHYILRTSWVIGEGNNFVRTMLSLGQRGIAPTVVSDQIGRLTFTTELVRAIDYLLKEKCDYGTYNVSNSGDPTSWANITRAVFKTAGYDLAVVDTTTAEYFKGKEGIAPRPLQSTLDLAKIQATGFSPTDWRDGLAEYIRREKI